jgi:hypothetical protein
MRNTELFNAAMALVKVTPLIRLVDKDCADYLLNKAEEYKSQIKIDEELEKEVLEFKKEIEAGL